MLLRTLHTYLSGNYSECTRAPTWGLTCLESTSALNEILRENLLSYELSINSVPYKIQRYSQINVFFRTGIVFAAKPMCNL